MGLFKSLGKIAKGAVKLAKENPEIAAVVLPVAGGVLVKASPKLAAKAIRIAPKVKAIIKAVK